MKQFFSFHIDLLGFFTSFICALHCIAVPLIFSLGLLGTGGMAHNHFFDLLFVGVGFGVASYSLIRDYKKYGSITPLLTGITAMILLLIGLFGHEGIHIVCSVTGGGMLAYAHYLNWKINHGACPVKA